MVVSIAVAGAVASGYSAYKQQRQQKKMQDQQLAMQRKQNAEAKKRAKEAKDRADIEQNKANKKKADVSAISSKEEQASMLGGGGTLLTGNQGVDPNKLNLGGNTLLGG